MDRPYDSPPGYITAPEAQRLYGVTQQAVQYIATVRGWKVTLTRGRAHAFDLDDFFDWLYESRAWERAQRQADDGVEKLTA